jgi:phosphoribosylformimino-5-aminoimidazole carboxamide ribotide isomerase
MEVIPAIDIRDGRCVRLEQGDYGRETIFGEDPVAEAVRWASMGARRIHVVDLDGARDGRQANASIVRRIVLNVGSSVQTGGGIRDIETLRSTLDSGVNRVVLGTAAVEDRAMLREAIATAREQLIVSVDARMGRVSTQGWTAETDLDALEWTGRLYDLGVERIVYTDIDRDGVRNGPNFQMYERLSASSSIGVIAAGGIGTVDDLQRLDAIGVEGAIIGRALYTGEIDLAAALTAVD